MRFGDTSITTDQQDSANTFASFYSLVHVNGPAGATVNGTSATGAHNMTYFGGSTAVAGKIDGAASGFDLTTPAGVGTAYAYSCWWKAVSNPGTSSGFWVMQLGNGGNDSGGMLWSHNNPSFIHAAYQQDSGGTYFPAQLTSSLVGGTWYLIHVEWDGSTLNCFRNGVAEGTASPATIKAISGALRWGQSEAGVMEELRLTSGAIRGASWNLADYNSQNDPATFVTFGTTTAV